MAFLSNAAKRDGLLRALGLVFVLAISLATWAQTPTSTVSPAPTKPVVTTPALATPTPVTPSANTLGTRDDPIPTNTLPAVETKNVVQMLFALAVVALIIKFLLPRWLQRMGGLKGASGFGEIKLIESKPLNNGTLHLIEARGRTLLVATTQGGANLIADLTEFEEQPAPQTGKSFETELRKAKPKAPTPDPEDPQPTRDNVEETLERLKRLSGQ
jgi:hypothetical protein